MTDFIHGVLTAASLDRPSMIEKYLEAQLQSKRRDNLAGALLTLMQHIQDREETIQLRNRDIVSMRLQLDRTSAKFIAVHDVLLEIVALLQSGNTEEATRLLTSSQGRDELSKRGINSEAQILSETAEWPEARVSAHQDDEYQCQFWTKVFWGEPGRWVRTDPAGPYTIHRKDKELRSLEAESRRTQSEIQECDRQLDNMRAEIFDIERLAHAEIKGPTLFSSKYQLGALKFATRAEAEAHKIGVVSRLADLRSRFVTQEFETEAKKHELSVKMARVESLRAELTAEAPKWKEVFGVL